MPTNDLITLVTFCVAIVLITPFLGRYIARVMEGERTFLSPIIGPVERGIYRIAGVDPTVEQGWKSLRRLGPRPGRLRDRHGLSRAAHPGRAAAQPRAGSRR